MSGKKFGEKIDNTQKNEGINEGITVNIEGVNEGTKKMLKRFFPLSIKIQW